MPAQARVDAANETPNPLALPAFAFTMWNPLLAGAATVNGEAQESYATLVAEWQSFVARRLKEDQALLQRLASSTALDQVWTAYADFWQKAADDYSCECATMGKIAADIANKTWKSTQSATWEAASERRPLRQS